jgi:CheY-like chemotaxis protein
VLIPYTIGKTRSLGLSANTKNKSLPDKNMQHLRVLLVEDNDINRLYAKSILKNWRCQTDTAENGLVAIEKIKNNSFDVVLMDVQMPVMDGYETTKAIRSMDPPLCKIPVVALTATATKADVEKCMAAGMNDYLPKPFTPDDLHRKLFEDLKITPAIRPASKKENKKPKTKYFDFSYLRSVSGNNEEFIQEMILTFSQSVPGILTDMRTSLNSKDWEKLSRLAHQIKPSFTLMGLDSMRSTLILIEEHGKSRKDLEELTQITEKFLLHCDDLMPHLKDEIA